MNDRSSAGTGKAALATAASSYCQYKEYAWPMYTIKQCTDKLLEGIKYYIGVGAAPDYCKAASCFWDAMLYGDLQAAYCMGVCYMCGNGVNQDAKVAVELWQKAVTDSYASFALGVCCDNGWGVPVNREMAQYCYKYSAQYGNARAVQSMRLVLTIDHSDKAYTYPTLEQPYVYQYAYPAVKQIAPTYPKPLTAYYIREMPFAQLLEAANAGNVQAQYQLGYNYYNSRGVAYDHNQALFWYYKAAQQGHTEAMNNLASCYELGADGVKNLYLAVQFYKQAASNGHAKAQYNLGRCYLKAIGIPSDKTQAAFWFEKAAAQYHQRAAEELYKLQYSTGYRRVNISKPNDTLEANELLAHPDLTNIAPSIPQMSATPSKYVFKGANNPYKRTEFFKIQSNAIEGQPDAQFRLANEYFSGAYLVQDQKRAVYWFFMAAQAGHVKAIYQLGYCFEYGYGVQQNQQFAEYLYYFAAATGSQTAQTNLCRLKKTTPTYDITFNCDDYLYDYQIECSSNANRASKYIEENMQFNSYLYSAIDAQYQPNSTSKFILAYPQEAYAQFVYEYAISTFEQCYKDAYAGKANAYYQLAQAYVSGEEIRPDAQFAFEWFSKAAYQHHIEATYELARCYRDGFGTNYNFIKAYKLFKQAADAEHVLAARELAECYQNGIGTQRDLRMAELWYKKAAAKENIARIAKLKEEGNFDKNANFADLPLEICYEQARTGNAQAYLQLAYRYFDGNGTKKDLTLAVHWYTKAANQHCLQAINGLAYCYLNGLGLATNQAQAIANFKTAANAGLAAAQCNLAKCYLNGDGVELDCSQAVYWLEKARAQKFTEAQRLLGDAYFQGAGVAKDICAAFYCYSDAAFSDDYEAQYKLAYCYFYGWGTKINQEKAFEWYYSAQEHNHLNAAIKVAYCCMKGYGCQVDYTKAAQIYWYLAEKGNSIGQFYLAQCSNYGTCVDKDFDRARYLFKNAAAYGHTKAYQELDKIYVKTNPVHFIFYPMYAKYYQAANAQIANGYYYSGLCNYFGIGIKENPKSAFYWYSKAARQNDPEAIFALAVCYYTGIGIEVSKDSAIKQLKLAAELGNASAQYLLGIQYLTANNISRDKTLGTDLLIKAAKQGHINAMDYMLRQSEYLDLLHVGFSQLLSMLKAKADKLDSLACYKLANCYAKGFAGKVDWEKAVHYYYLAAYQKNVDAMIQVAQCYLSGHGVSANVDQAKQYLQMAEKYGSSDATMHLRQMQFSRSYNISSYERNSTYYQRESWLFELSGCKDDEDTDRYYGTRVRGQKRNNTTEVVSIVQRAAESGNAIAYYGLGKCYQTSVIFDRNDQIAFEWFDKAARQGDVHALNELGLCCESGRGVDTDMNRAYQYFEQAAEEGNVAAQYNLGRCYLQGIGVVKNYERAAALFYQAATSGYADAEISLAECYKNGTGVSVNYTKGLHALYRMANNGNERALLLIADSYRDGRGVAQSDELACYWYMQAAELQFTEANLRLADCYKSGKCVAKSVPEELRYLGRAAELGDDTAIRRFADYYFTGTTVKKDYDMAISYYYRASQLTADYMMAYAYCLAYKTRRDPFTIICLYRKAAAALKTEIIQLAKSFY